MNDDTRKQLMKRVEEERKRGDYYKKIAVDSGKIHLKESEYLSSIIQSYKEIIVDLKKEIGDRKSAENAVKESHQQLLTILNSIDADIYVSDMETYRVLFANSHIQKSFGRDLVGEKCFEVFREMDSICDHCTNDQLLDDKGNPSGLVVWQGQNPITRKWYINNDREIKWPDGRNVRIQIATDISDLKRLESERKRNEAALRRSRQLELIGTLAGGLAHDFNNLLMGIQGWISIISAEFDESNPVSGKIRAIESYIESASSLTKQLLGFARKGKYEVRPMDINEMLVESSTMFGRTAKEITINTQLHQPAPVVDGDGKQIEQVLLNLYINALQAMPKKGEIYLESSIVSVNNEFCRPYGAKPGKYAKVTVKDTGLGMDKDTLERIFDPFFTTKDRGRGTGLGLASVYGIVKSHDGMITVKSTPGKGTTFDIYLPLSRNTVKAEPAAQDGVLKGSETILLVDDEEMILEVGQAMLENLGYRVKFANSGKSAIHILNEHSGDIDLVILDLIMPGMDGGATFSVMREAHPKIPILLSSGYSIDGDAEKILKKGCDGFIQKPFKLSEFSQKIRNILDAKRVQGKD